MDYKKLSIEKWNTDYTVQWRPLDMCNYDCSYCSPSNHIAINKKHIPKIDTLIEASQKLRNNIPIDKINDIYDLYKNKEIKTYFIEVKRSDKLVMVEWYK